MKVYAANDEEINLKDTEDDVVPAPRKIESEEDLIDYASGEGMAEDEDMDDEKDLDFADEDIIDDIDEELNDDILVDDDDDIDAILEEESN